MCVTSIGIARLSWRETSSCLAANIGSVIDKYPASLFRWTDRHCRRQTWNEATSDGSIGIHAGRKRVAISLNLNNYRGNAPAGSSTRSSRFRSVWNFTFVSTVMLYFYRIIKRKKKCIKKFLLIIIFIIISTIRRNNFVL